MFVQRIYDKNEICNDINGYLNYFDEAAWTEYTGIKRWKRKLDADGMEGYVPDESCDKREILLALNICTFHRNEQTKKNIEKLRGMKFFNPSESDYYGRMHVFITDNGAELEEIKDDFFHLSYNKNTGGSGGFQKGLEHIREFGVGFTHVVFMDDDADFLPETFYRLFALLAYMKPEHYNRSVAGRMFSLDDPKMQYTAAEIWNGGDLQHVGFMKDMSCCRPLKLMSGMDCNAAGYTDNSGIGKDAMLAINEAGDADYGGWWFCCYPYDFCKNNDVISFFLHCDDVEYGLRFMNAGGGRPIILNGIQVWHETYVYRQNPIIQYYDTRNPLLVNEKYGLMPDSKEVYDRWFSKITEFHVKEDYASEYYTILGMLDYLKGMDYLYRIDPEKKHKKLSHARISKLKNSILWRIVKWRYKNEQSYHPC